MKKILVIFLVFPVLFFHLGIVCAADSINVKLVANKHESSLDRLSDYFGVNTVCDDNNENCINSTDSRFFIKLYDLYYLYLSKYNIKLDLSLIMSTLSYKYDDIKDMFKYNLSYYDRKTIVENDWKPSSTTELDWDYDYESSKNYLVSNDASLDMQVLAKNMVAKITLQKCTKDGKTVTSKQIADYEEDLKCNDGETLEKGTSSYKLDLDKYNEFLLEFIEKKYYSGRVSDSPGYKDNLKRLYYTDKVPSVSKKKKSKSKKSSNNTGEYDSEVVEKLNAVALGEVGNAGSKYQEWFGSYDNWCGMFVSWVFDQVQTDDNPYILKYAGAGAIPRESVKAGLGTWLEDECYDPSTVPQAGDIVLYNPSPDKSYSYFAPWPENGGDEYFSSHVGYVYKVDDDYIYTVEGNSIPTVTTKKVSRKYCGHSGSEQGINGYYRPNYFKNSGDESSDESSDKSSEDSSSEIGSVVVSSPGQFKKDIIYYNQYDYSNYSYGTDSYTYGNIGSHGCGPTSLAIAISSLLQEEHDPVEMTEHVCSLGGCTYDGSTEASICQTAQDYGSQYGFSAYRTSDLQDVVDKLSSGKALIVTITNGGFYTTSGIKLSNFGHFFVLTGVESEDRIYIADPANSFNFGHTVSLSGLSDNSHNTESTPSFCILTF